MHNETQAKIRKRIQDTKRNKERKKMLHHQEKKKMFKVRIIWSEIVGFKLFDR